MREPSSLQDTERVPRHGVRGHRKVKIGVVVSNKMAKTIVVRIGRFVQHPKYGRVIKRASTFKVHDEAGSAAIGDVVKIMETRPVSREKRWRLVEILKRASTAPPVPGEESEPVRQETEA
ncbi:MAG: 30S ribosomal protein S17 [Candidatus Omnitrophica bacterium]|nr:30S ribosomal protein S17 [Candidatus Omnitrophota bacterium]